MTTNTRLNEQQPRHRILHVTFNMGFGGTEQVIRQLVMHLPQDQFSNEILCIDGEVGEMGQRLEAGHHHPSTQAPARAGLAPGPGYSPAG
jgi:hypothetical protein